MEGHRLVSFIPPLLRDAHVAGFTQYLLDGQTSYFGRWARVPGLHRDGSEIGLRLYVERAHDVRAGEYFVATVERA
jgi:hypothetical protein